MEAQKQDNKEYTPKFEEQKDIDENPPTFLYNVVGNLKSSSMIPTMVLANALANTATMFYSVPKKVADQMIVYQSGSTYRLYVADLTNSTWHYITFTS